MTGATALPPPGDPRTLYVIDVSGYVFRAYHALPPLMSPSGEPTHAVLGVTSMLLKLLAERQPARIAVAMDSRTPSFRHGLFDAYKANRPPAPPDLSQQMRRVQEVLEALALPVLQRDGFEADDLIASVVRAARERGLKVVVVSSDKDLLQLIGDDVCMYDTARGVVFGAPETVAKLGVPPTQVRDYLALVGDSSDNVPGVPSVGPKTAVELLRQFGDLDALYGGLDQVERKALREKLAAGRDKAYLSRELVTLRDELPLGRDVETLASGTRDVAHLRGLFTTLGFTRVLAQLGEVAVAAGGATGTGATEGTVGAAGAAPGEAVAATPEAIDVQVVLDATALDALARSLAQAGSFALVSAMQGTHPMTATLVGLAFAWRDGRAYVPLAHGYLGRPDQIPEARVLASLRAVLEDAAVVKLCADAKRETMFLAERGVVLRGVTFDVGLASYLIDPERHAHRLEDVARFDLALPQPEVDGLLPVGKESDELASTEVAEVAARAARSARVVQQAHAALVPRLEQAGCAKLLVDVELPLVRVLADIERTGIRVDADRLRVLEHEVAGRLGALEMRCKELAGRDFNVGSPRQLEAILFDELKLPSTKKTKTARSTDQGVLEDLAALHELPRVILEHRMLAKLKNTYLDTLPKQIHPRTGRIHTDFRQAVAATGRLSSSDPNLQNIPIRTDIGREIRSAFVPREGWRLLSADYSQIELRVLAHISHDAALIEAFSQGADVHARTARAIFGVPEEALTREMRGRAKTVNYAVIYGQTQFALARNLRIERSEAARYIKAFFEQYAGVAAYMERVVQEGRERGFVSTLFGRVRHLPELRSDNRMQREAAERVARNTPIQGSAADIIKLAMIAVHREIGTRKLESKMLLSVHDELVFEAPPAEKDALEALVVERMQDVVKLDVPLVVDSGWGAHWGEAH